MAKLNFEYYIEPNTKSNNSTEQIRNGYINDKFEVDCLDNWSANPMLRHLSQLRQNMLVWYDFKENSQILEISSDYGIMTDLLCRKGSYVISLEASKKRAQINYERNKEYSNLEIIVGNFADVEFDRKFDYIILNDAFVNAASHVNTNAPHFDFMKAISKILNDDGCILLVVENRLGSRFFSGVEEKYTHSYFMGINGYNDAEQVRTFSKIELKELCAAADLMCEKFYYPYPDCDVPSEIFTDETINTSLYGKDYLQILERRFAFVNEPYLIKSLIKEGIADIFANAFLVEIRKKQEVRVERKQERNIQYVKLNTDRNEDFQLYTVVYEADNQKRVDKCALGDKSKAHLQKMYEYGVANHDDKWTPLLPQYNGKSGIMTYPWVETDSYSTMVANFISLGEKEAIVKLLKELRILFLDNAKVICPYKNDDFLRVFCGSNKKESSLAEYNLEEEFQCIDSGNIDIILSNIFAIQDVVNVIDYEWVFDFPIPVEYIVWRMLDALYHEHGDIEGIISREQLEMILGITKEHAILFRQWENHFVYDYVGCNKLETFLKPMLQVDLAAIANRELANSNSNMKIYVDKGNGFSEEYSIEKSVDISDGRFEVSFELDDDWIQLRFDPTDYACKISNLEVYYGEQKLEKHPVNAYSIDGFEVFPRSDPNYLIAKINVGENMKAGILVVSGCIELLTPQLMDEYQAKIFSKYYQLKCVIEDREQHINEQNQQLNEQSQQLNEQSQRLSEQSQRLNEQEQQLNEQKQNLDSQAKLIVELDADKQQLLNELGAIKGSRLYKLYEIKDKVKNNK